MEYTTNLIKLEITRLEKRLDDEKGFLKDALKYVENHEAAVKATEVKLEELRKATNVLTAQDTLKYREPGC